MKTGNTETAQKIIAAQYTRQWSPVMKTGNTRPAGAGLERLRVTAMEPGHEDREYTPLKSMSASTSLRRQWSPVMKTGNTRNRAERGH